MATTKPKKSSIQGAISSDFIEMLLQSIKVKQLLNNIFF
jgi:hypothetical protein